MEISVFTEILQELGNYSAAVDNGTASHADFADFQRLEERIIRAHNHGYFDHARKQALYVIAQNIHDNFRVVLGLDR